MEYTYHHKDFDGVTTKDPIQLCANGKNCEGYLRPPPFRSPYTVRGQRCPSNYEDYPLKELLESPASADPPIMATTPLKVGGVVVKGKVCYKCSSYFCWECKEVTPQDNRRESFYNRFHHYNGKCNACWVAGGRQLFEGDTIRRRLANPALNDRALYC